MLWSILIAAVPERYHTVQPLLYSLLETQAVGRMSDIELLYLLDNKRRTVGAKRNALFDAARGQYISFVDDDDMVAPDYVQRIHDALLKVSKMEPPVDVITFGQRATLHPHGIVHECTYSLTHKTRELKPTAMPNVFAWTGPPAHTMVWRRAVIGDTRFPEKQFGEDVEWVDAVCARASSEAQIEGAPLYFYQFDSERSATRG